MQSVIFSQVVQKQVREIQHCQKQILNLMPSKIFLLSHSVFISLLIQVISIPVRHDIKWFNSNISLILWCKILFREWHTFWHLRFFTEIWNTKTELLPATEVKHLPQVLNNKISFRNMDSQCPNGKLLPAFLIFLPKTLMAEAGVFSTNNVLFSKIPAMLGNWGMINWTHTPDSCKNSNGWRDVQIVPWSRMPCWKG